MATLTIDLDAPTPITEQIVAGLRRSIAAGKLCPGDELPPVRQLAADLGVNLNTVARAYRVLESSGLVSTARGRGTRVLSAVETRQQPAEVTAAHIEQRVATAVTDAKLAGLSQSKLESVFRDVVAAIFPDLPEEARDASG